MTLVFGSLVFQESDDEFGNPSEDDQKTVRLYTVLLATCDTVKMQERGDKSCRQLSVKNFS